MVVIKFLIENLPSAIGFNRNFSSRIPDLIRKFFRKKSVIGIGIDGLGDASFLRADLKELYKQTNKDKLTRLKVVYSKAKPA